MRCANPGPCSSQPQGHKTAVRFHRIKCTICFTSPETKETTPAGKGHDCCLHLFMSCILSKAEAAGTKNEVSDCSGRLHLKGCRSLGALGQPEQRESSQTMNNRKANCFPLLTRITKLKCVNSVVRSVTTHPKKGCLNWPYGTLSESP